MLLIACHLVLELLYNKPGESTAYRIFTTLICYEFLCQGFPRLWLVVKVMS